MISYVIGDLFDSPAQTLVNTVNTVGVMGKGIALGFKQRYPAMFAEYKQLCEENRLKIGTLYVYRTPKKLVLNFPTKENWRKPSKLEWIEHGLRTFVEHYRDAGIHSVAFPPLGCGNGELNYRDVRPLMEKYLEGLPIPVYLYPPLKSQHLAEHRIPVATSAWLATKPYELSFNHVWQNDVRELVVKYRRFAKLGSHRTFDASWTTAHDEDGVIVVRSARNEYVITTDSARYFWNELVANPLVTTRAFPAEDSPFLFGIFSKLPYVRHFLIADTYEDLEREGSWGLKLVPPSTHVVALTDAAQV